jgi:hypothetical protein
VGVGGGLDGKYDGAEADLQEVREGGSWDDPFARGTRTIRMCSSDARSGDHPSHPQVKR